MADPPPDPMRKYWLLACIALFIIGVLAGGWYHGKAYSDEDELIESARKVSDLQQRNKQLSKSRDSAVQASEAYEYAATIWKGRFERSKQVKEKLKQEHEKVFFQLDSSSVADLDSDLFARYDSAAH